MSAVLGRLVQTGTGTCRRILKCRTSLLKFSEANYSTKDAKNKLPTKLPTSRKKEKEKESIKPSGASSPRGHPLLHIPKLDDAYEAAGPNSALCTLILTEGDSAKALVVAGLSQLGRDHYGVFPLRGKFLNVRDANMEQVAQNAEVQALLEILGLKLGVPCPDPEKSLRYGRVMIMTDQDHDGSHIKGLLINFLDHFWPELIARPGFLEEFITPLIKVRRRNEERVFFTLPEFDAWKLSDSASSSSSLSATSGWTVKYYKGLGTSTSAEAKQYFSAMSDHRVSFLPSTGNDRESLDLVFNRKRAEDRKNWLLNHYSSSLYVNHVTARLAGGLSFNDFIYKELIHFSMADNVRSIPNVMDGLKPSQRKVLFACFKKNLRNEMKVAQLAGYVAQVSAYHHGEQSLSSTIVNMAQDYVGSNNIHLLEPCGQFGTRLQNGKDSASPRYIFTHLSPLTFALFSKEDEPSLQYLSDDGQSIEPEYYVPILPLVLVNGTDGIGTGWSTFVPNHNPRIIVENLKRKMAGTPYLPMNPWYRGFKGTIMVEKGNYIVHGVCKKISPNEVEVTELPLRRWSIESYKEFLQQMCRAKGPAATATDNNLTIKSFQEFHTDSQVRFVLTMTEKQMKLAEDMGLLKALKLDANLSTGNMTLFSPGKAILKYSSVEEIMDAFYDTRLGLYQQRQLLLIQRLSDELAKANLRMRFIQGVVSQEIAILGVPKQDAVNAALSYLKESDVVFVEALLALPMNYLFQEKLQAMMADVVEMEKQLAVLKSKTPIDLWREDLDNFMRVYDKFEKK